jgi:thioredoxin-dependent peroxiredoxin
MSITIKQAAVDFTLPADDGRKISLKNLRGKKVILYFYPKDDTSGCTKESCAFRDTLPDFSKAQTEIIGISRDNIASHQKFKQKYALPFTLLSDVDGTVCEAYGVWVEKSMYGKKYKGIERSTFLIDENGIIQNIWRKVKVDGHVEAVLASLKIKD